MFSHFELLKLNCKSKLRPFNNIFRNQFGRRLANTRKLSSLWITHKYFFKWTRSKLLPKSKKKARYRFLQVRNSIRVYKFFKKINKIIRVRSGGYSNLECLSSNFKAHGLVTNTKLLRFKSVKDSILSSNNNFKNLSKFLKVDNKKLKEGKVFALQGNFINKLKTFIRFNRFLKFNNKLVNRLKFGLDIYNYKSIPINKYIIEYKKKEQHQLLKKKLRKLRTKMFFQKKYNKKKKIFFNNLVNSVKSYEDKEKNKIKKKNAKKIIKKTNVNNIKKIKTNKKKKKNKHKLGFNFNVLDLLKVNSKKLVKFKKNPFRSIIPKLKVKRLVSKFKKPNSPKGLKSKLVNFNNLKKIPFFLMDLTQSKKGSIHRFFYLSYIRQLSGRDVNKIKRKPLNISFKVKKDKLITKINNFKKYNFITLNRKIFFKKYLKKKAKIKKKKAKTKTDNLKKWCKLTKVKKLKILQKDLKKHLNSKLVLSNLIRDTKPVFVNKANAFNPNNKDFFFKKSLKFHTNLSFFYFYFKFYLALFFKFFFLNNNNKVFKNNKVTNKFLKLNLLYGLNKVNFYNRFTVSSKLKKNRFLKDKKELSTFLFKKRNVLNSFLSFKKRFFFDKGFFFFNKKKLKKKSLKLVNKFNFFYKTLLSFIKKINKVLVLDNIYRPRKIKRILSNNRFVFLRRFNILKKQKTFSFFVKKDSRIKFNIISLTNYIKFLKKKIKYEKDKLPPKLLKSKTFKKTFKFKKLVRLSTKLKLITRQLYLIKKKKLNEVKAKNRLFKLFYKSLFFNKKFFNERSYFNKNSIKLIIKKNFIKEFETKKLRKKKVELKKKPKKIKKINVKNIKKINAKNIKKINAKKAKKKLFLQQRLNLKKYLKKNLKNGRKVFVRQLKKKKFFENIQSFKILKKNLKTTIKTKFNGKFIKKKKKKVLNLNIIKNIKKVQYLIRKNVVYKNNVLLGLKHLKRLKRLKGIKRKKNYQKKSPLILKGIFFDNFFKKFLFLKKFKSKKKTISNLYSKFRYIYALHKQNRFIKFKNLRSKTIYKAKFIKFKINKKKKKKFIKNYIYKKNYNIKKRLKKSNLISKKYKEYIKFLQFNKIKNYNDFIKYFYSNKILFNKLNNKLIFNKRKLFSGGLRVIKNIFNRQINSKGKNVNNNNLSTKNFISKKFLTTNTGGNSSFNKVKTKSLQLFGNRFSKGGNASFSKIQVNKSKIKNKIPSFSKRNYHKKLVNYIKGIPLTNYKTKNFFNKILFKSKNYLAKSLFKKKFFKLKKIKRLTKNVTKLRKKNFFKNLNKHKKFIMKPFFSKEKKGLKKKSNFVKFYTKYRLRKLIEYKRKVGNKSFIFRRNKFLKYLKPFNHSKNKSNIIKKKKRFSLRKYIFRLKKKKHSKYKFKFYNRKHNFYSRKHKFKTRKNNIMLLKYRLKNKIKGKIKTPLYIRLNNLKKSIKRHKFKPFVKYKEARYKKLYRRIGSIKLKKKTNLVTGKRIKIFNNLFLNKVKKLKPRKFNISRINSNNIKRIKFKKLGIEFLKTNPLVVKKSNVSCEQTKEPILGFCQINSKVLSKLRLIKEKFVFKKKQKRKLRSNITFFNSWILFFHSFNLKQLHSTCTKNLYLYVKKNFVYWSFVQKQQKYSIYFWYNFYNFRSTFSKVRNFKSSSLNLNLGKFNNQTKLLINISFQDMFFFSYILSNYFIFLQYSIYRLNNYYKLETIYRIPDKKKGFLKLKNLLNSFLKYKKISKKFYFNVGTSTSTFNFLIVLLLKVKRFLKNNLNYFLKTFFIKLIKFTRLIKVDSLNFAFINSKVSFNNTIQSFNFKSFKVFNNSKFINKLPFSNYLIFFKSWLYLKNSFNSILNNKLFRVYNNWIFNLNYSLQYYLFSKLYFSFFNYFFYIISQKFKNIRTVLNLKKFEILYDFIKAKDNARYSMGIRPNTFITTFNRRVKKGSL